MFVGATLAACQVLYANETTNSAALVKFGESLFADTELSGDRTTSCATCHVASQAFADSKRVAVGIAGKSGLRNTPSLLNASVQDSFFWDGRRATLEQQVLDPLTNPNEHGISSLDAVVSIVRVSPKYREFAAAKSATINDVALALAAYVRSLGAGESRFDRYLLRDDRSALSAEERGGFEIFRGPAGCTRCHQIGPTSTGLTDNRFHSVSHLPKELMDSLEGATVRSVSASPAELERLITSDASVAELGRFNVTHRPSDIGKYRTPSLRNVVLTAPYMHDGSVATLEDAVDAEIYYRGLEQGRPLILTPRERKSLVAFLHSLTFVSLETIQGKQ